MKFTIFAPKKMDTRDGFLRRAVIIAETQEEEKSLWNAVYALSHDGWPFKPPPIDCCPAFPECTHTLAWYEEHKAWNLFQKGATPPAGMEEGKR
jgi:hypothetical protein